MKMAGVLPALDGPFDIVDRFLNLERAIGPELITRQFEERGGDREFYIGRHIASDD